MAASDPHILEHDTNSETKSLHENNERLKNSFIGSIDQGTTSTRFLVFDGLGTPVASHQVEFKQIYPHSGWVCHARRSRM